MARKFVNRLAFIVANNPGATGDVTVGQAAIASYAGSRTLGAADDGSTLDVRFEQPSGAWEQRTGCGYTHATTTLTRGTLADSSTGGALTLVAGDIAVHGPHASWAASLVTGTVDSTKRNHFVAGAGNSTTASTDNCGLGLNVLAASVSGECNTGFGQHALESCQSGTDHTAIGNEALRYVIGGVGSTAIGKRALWSDITGNGNTGCGDTTLEANQTGIRNTAVGYGAMRQIVTGNDNVAVGNGAGVSCTGGASYNTFIGMGAGGIAAQKVDAQNSIAIGTSSATTADNQTVIGNGSSIEVVLRGSRLSLGENGFGINASGSKYTINGATSTGTGTGGVLAFATSPAGVTGAATNAPVERWNITADGHFWSSSHNSYDIGADGAWSPRNVWAASNVYGGNIIAAASAILGVRGRSQISSPSDGIFRLMNATNNGFDRLQFGLSTSAAPALKRSGAALAVRLADDSADAAISCSVVRTVPVTAAALPSASTAGSGARAFVTDATASTFASVLAGGGSTSVPVYSDGTDWRVG